MRKTKGTLFFFKLFLGSVCQVAWGRRKWYYSVFLVSFYQLASWFLWADIDIIDHQVDISFSSFFFNHIFEWERKHRQPNSDCYKIYFNLLLQRGLFEDITEGIREAKVIVACVSNEVRWHLQELHKKFQIDQMAKL
jgi:hypothetical protein